MALHDSTCSTAVAAAAVYVDVYIFYIFHLTILRIFVRVCQCVYCWWYLKWLKMQVFLHCFRCGFINASVVFISCCYHRCYLYDASALSFYFSSMLFLVSMLITFGQLLVIIVWLNWCSRLIVPRLSNLVFAAHQCSCRSYCWHCCCRDSSSVSNTSGSCCSCCIRIPGPLVVGVPSHLLVTVCASQNIPSCQTDRQTEQVSSSGDQSCWARQIGPGE